ncbi:MAG: Ig-like domain-containing protein, partial [Actinomycetota bacterium]|nr:Ig-like domain-containing protein [Actinomycetota bacterium]
MNVFHARGMAVLALLFPALVSAQVSMSTSGASEDFDSLASSGGTSGTLPTGWFLFESGSNADTTYGVGDGTQTAGNTYSFGTGTNAERAFGSLLSGSVTPRFGAQLRNDTGSVIEELPITYVGEQWRLGTAGREDRLDFQYSTNATSLGSGDWIDIDALDFIAPIQAGTLGGLNGNLPANSALIESAISALALAPGESIWIRWMDFNGSGADDGLAIDNIVFGPFEDVAPTLAHSDPFDGQMDVLVSSDIELEFSEPVTTTATWFTLDCGGTIATTVDGTGATRVISPVADLPFSTACTLTLQAANILDADGTQDPLAGDNVVAFTTAQDTAPSVQTITPAHQATGVAVNANVSIAFSEAVATTDPWIQITCTPSGAHPGTITGSGSNRQFDPSTNFAPGDACTVTLTPANIVDQDGIAQPLADQSTFTFDVAPDLAPTITATFPAHGATNVAVGSNLSVTFSEPVTAVAGAFGIACGATAHPFSQTNVAQTTYTLDPDDDFAADEDCTLDIDPAFVFDIDGTPNALTAGATIGFTTSAGVSGYYERVDTSSCRALRATLHGVIDDHVSYSYDPRSGPDNDTWEILEPADQDPTSPGMILDIYENKKFTKISDRTGSSNCTGSYNREHTWPKSLGFPSESGDLGLPNAPHT